jgi:hypothetical protein
MTAVYRHPWPKEIAMSHCPKCARLTRGRQVNQEDRIPPRYCRICGGLLEVAIFAYVRPLQPLEPEK